MAAAKAAVRDTQTIVIVLHVRGVRLQLRGERLGKVGMRRRQSLLE